MNSCNGVPTRIADGAVRGAVVGTLIHGLFENQGARGALLYHLRARRGLPRPVARALPPREAEYDRLAAIVREHLDWKMLAGLVGR